MPTAGWSQNGESTHANAPMAQAVRAVGTLSVDGMLTEAAWASAPVITAFTQRDPDEGAPVSEPTEVRILYDAGGIYIGAVLRDRQPVSTRLGRRDANFQDSDQFAVIFDSYHDHQTAFRFAVNPSGVKRDEVISGGGSFGGGPGGFGGGDATWDPVWSVATTVTDSGWVVEMRIPFGQLRFSPAGEQTWGIQLERRIARRQELALFAHTPKAERSGVSRYGHLTGLRDLTTQGRLEVLPYASARADYRQVAQNPAVPFGNPFRSGSDMTQGFGADVKYRLTSNFTLDLTINPDFGQVELDPAVVNLTAFETRLEERRPFFIEGASIFRFGFGGMGGSSGSGGGSGGVSQIIYSRRIGRVPQVAVPAEAVYSTLPETATILGAAKLTGRTANGWSFGILEAVTGEERARYVRADQGRGESVVEPLTNYFAGRLRRDLGNGRTRLGAIATAVNRVLDDPVLEDRLRDAAYVGGLDIGHDWSNRMWSLIGTFSSSYISGSTPVMLAAQRSSARYFQRPDAGHLALDSAASSLTGYFGMLNVGKRAGLVSGSGTVGFVSPGYEVNDLGFQTTADRISLSGQLAYNRNRPGPVFREWRLDASAGFTYNYDGDLVERRAGLSSSFQFLNYWGGSIRVGRGGGTVSDRLTRGGPLAWDPVGYSVRGELRSDPRRAYTISTEASREWNEVGGYRSSAEVGLGWRPAANWEIQVSPQASWSRSTAQYVTVVTDPAAAATFGRRYIFADLDQTEVALATRLNVTFSPTVSLELYAQPLLAAGDYGALKELRTPRTLDFTIFGVDAGTISEANGRYTIDPDGSGPAPSFGVNNRDFTALELRGNAVLRWEFRPGSALFLVWQQRRSDELDAFGPEASRAGRFDLGRDLRGLAGLRAENVFMVKMSYWFNR